MVENTLRDGRRVVTTAESRPPQGGFKMRPQTHEPPLNTSAIGTVGHHVWTQPQPRTDSPEPDDTLVTPTTKQVNSPAGRQISTC